MNPKIDFKPFESKALLAEHRDHVERLHQAYREILSRFSLDGILLEAGADSLKHPRDDAHWPFIFEPFFAHWLPVREGALLVTRDNLTLYRPAEISYWDSTPSDDAVWDRKSFTEKRFLNLKDIELPTKSVAIGYPPFAQKLNLEEATADLVQALEDIRVTKSPYEVSCLVEATRRAWLGHKQLKDSFFSSRAVSEFDLFLEYLHVTEQTVYETAYDPIVAFGKNAAVLHHILYEKKKVMTQNTSFLLDAGSRFQGYASDITRTYVRGNSSEAKVFGALIAGIDSLQQKLAQKFTIGTDYQALHNESHEGIALLMRDLELTKDLSQEELIAKGVTRAFFPHGLGHSLGLQVHDVGLKRRKTEARNPYLRNTSEIAEGHVATIEPGFYFIDQLMQPLRDQNIKLDWSLIDRLRPMGGIRVEDNVLATTSGPVNLTRPLESAHS